VRSTLAFIQIAAAVLSASTTAAKAPPVTVTIAAAPTVVVYGGAVSLSGAVSSQKTGEKVGVQAQACGQAAFKGAGDTKSVAAGAWSLSERPTMNTQYRAKVKNATSAAVGVSVRPNVALTKVARRKYTVRVSAAQSFAGRLITFQRFKPSTQGWVRVRKATLRQISTGPGATIVSGITFRSKIRTGLRVRAVLAKAQAGSCYLAGVSAGIRS
jgi:hypothetical protein